MVDKTDTVLVEQLKNGDEKAFELLVLRYRPRLIASLTNYTKSVEVSEDISKQTFIRVWQKIDTFRGDSSLFTWIYRIGVNLVKNNFVSKHTKQDLITDQFEENESNIYESLSPEHYAISEETAQQAYSFIAKLPEDLKTALCLREFDNQSYEDISIIMDCPIGTVRSRIFRARELLLEFLEKEIEVNNDE